MPPKGRKLTAAPAPVDTTLSTPPQAPPTDRGLGPQVAATLSHLELKPEDAAVAELAREYARTIDTARIIAAQLARMPVTEDNAEELAKLRAKVAAHSTMADIGPKLLAALDALGATPKARAAAKDQKPPAAGGGKLGAMQAVRA